LTFVLIIDMIGDMTKRITANLATGLLDEATKITGKGITETLTEGLLMIRRSRAFTKAQALRGKIQLDLDMDEIRERTPETRGRYQP
jgi:hypothetical protein